MRPIAAGGRQLVSELQFPRSKTRGSHKPECLVVAMAAGRCFLLMVQLILKYGFTVCFVRVGDS